MSLPDSHPRRNLGNQFSTKASTAHYTTATVTDSSLPAMSTGNDSGSLTPNSSPPLIVAFLAIGLFMAAMIAIFGWRRLTYGRGVIRVVRMASPEADSQNAMGDFRETPKLWNLEIHPPVQNKDELTWQEMMVSTYVTSNDRSLYLLVV